MKGLRGQDIRKHQDKYQPTDQMFWIMELTAQIESLKRTVQDLARKVTKAGNLPTQPRPEKGFKRKYYAIEYVKSNPPKLDWIGRERPRDGHFDHQVVATSLLEAEKMIMEKIRAERAREIAPEETEESTDEPAA